jgi:tRNA A-37 threonylcarbamoyl transferase component Bud32
MGLTGMSAVERACVVVSNPDLFQRLASALADRYALEREIGSGGMATVYLAEDRKHHRRVAIKVLHPDLTRSLGAERFLREIRTTANLHHPHILPLFDSGEADGFLYYVMPFVRGESLRSRLERDGQLSIHEAVRIAREIADALNFAHEQGVIHRDVKPANILLDAGHAMLADFGVAQALAFAEDTTLTGSGTFLGTPTYMSPEQAAGGEVIDGRSDQYALGCVLYEMLSGHPPFGGPRAEVILRQQWAADPPALGKVRGSIPPPVSAVVARALKKRPEERYATALDMAAALEAAMSSKEGLVFRILGRPVALGLSAGLLAAFAIGVVLSIRGGRFPDEEPKAGTMAAASQRQVSFSGAVERFALSPDGRFVAYTEGSPADARILVQRIDGGDPTLVYQSANAAVQSLWWMPGGESLGFRVEVRMSRPVSTDESPLSGLGDSRPQPRGSMRDFEVPIVGGRAETLEKSVDPRGSNLKWSPDGQRVAWGWEGSRPGLWLSQAGGPLVEVTPLTSIAPRLYPWTFGGFRPLDSQPVAWSPDGRWLVHLMHLVDSPQNDSATIRLFSVDSGESHTVWGDWAPGPQLEANESGVLLLRGPSELRELLMVPMNWETGQVRGGASTVGFFDGVLGFSASAGGRLILKRGKWSDGGVYRIGRVSVDPDGTGRTVSEPLPWSKELFSIPVVSPDGTKLAAIRGLIPNQQLVVLDLSDGSTRAISKPMSWMGGVAWSTTGRLIACLATEGGKTLAHAFDVSTGGLEGRSGQDLPRGSLLFWQMDEVLYYADVGRNELYSLALPGGTEARVSPELHPIEPLSIYAFFPFSIAISPSGDSLVGFTYVASNFRLDPSRYRWESRLRGLRAAFGGREGHASPVAWTTEGLYWLIEVSETHETLESLPPGGGRRSLWIVRAGSAEPQKLIDFGEHGVPPCYPSSMSLDGRILVCHPFFSQFGYPSLDEFVAAAEPPFLLGADLWVVDLEIDGLRGPGS